MCMNYEATQTARECFLMYLSTMTKPASACGFVAFISTLSIDLTSILLLFLLLFLTYTIAITVVTMSSSRTVQPGTSTLRRIVMRFLFSVGVGGCEASGPTVWVGKT